MSKVINIVAIEAVRDDFQGDSDGKTLPTLRCAVENFQLWLEYLIDSAVEIRLGIKRGVA